MEPPLTLISLLPVLILSILYLLVWYQHPQLVESPILEMGGLIQVVAIRFFPEIQQLFIPMDQQAVRQYQVRMLFVMDY